MDKISFKRFVWPENPEQFEMDGRTDPLYEVGPAGKPSYHGLSPVSREITVGGAFHGSGAGTAVKELSALLDDRVHGLLVHPMLGSWQAYLTRVTVRQQSRKDCFDYTAQFRLADAEGNIPPKIDETLPPPYPAGV